MHPFIGTLLASSRESENVNRLSPEGFAKIIAKLIALEREEGGPYTLCADSAEDIFLNLAAWRFLFLQGISLPKLDAYIEALDDRELRSDAERALLKKFGERKIVRNPNHIVPAHAPTAGEQRMLGLVQECAAQRFSELPSAFQSRAIAVIERTLAGNADLQMPLISYYFREALGSCGSMFDDGFVAEMGFANVCFWTSFIIYDDFWDEDEAAEPRDLPVANLFARHFIHYFSTLFQEDTGFRAYFQILMDRLDSANAWETESCRMKKEGDAVLIPAALPDYGEYDAKFYPAAGHVLGPLAMLQKLGYPPESAESKHLVAYFRHMLIAMQLNDDAHDWEEDLLRGHLSTAVVPLLELWKEQYPGEERLVLSVSTDELRELFWYEALPPLVDKTLEHARLAREALRNIALIGNPEPLTRLVEVNEESALRAKEEMRLGSALLEAFS